MSNRSRRQRSPQNYKVQFPFFQTGTGERQTIAHLFVPAASSAAQRPKTERERGSPRKVETFKFRNGLYLFLTRLLIFGIQFFEGKLSDYVWGALVRDANEQFHAISNLSSAPTTTPRIKLDGAAGREEGGVAWRGGDAGAGIG
ncbi:hypothetical protein GWI33_009024 [Rhynchophorus ferrugineus]|uniref:Uncharacterized protein n=1 Tax=Rhynchophorus ferrugineus TaxID=354439 RepID=A0A834MFH0_RHYFE|nr:hypothetical protein GWI33_009024 [Rhynchophorus ferrugineus]